MKFMEQKKAFVICLHMQNRRACFRFRYPPRRKTINKVVTSRTSLSVSYFELTLN